MNSTNIRKVKYTESKPSVISLKEYVIVSNEQLDEKHIVFKFQNLVNQKLIDFRFEVKQFDEHKNILEESKISYSGDLYDENAVFIPNAKLKANKFCSYIEVKILSATFERSTWENGEFADNRHSLDAFREISEEGTATEISGVEEDLKKHKKKVKKEKQTLKKIENNDKKLNKQRGNKKIFVRDITNNNRPRGPIVSSIIMTVLCFIAIVGIPIYGKATDSYFNDITYEDFTYSFDSTSQEYTAVRYCGNGLNAIIPDEIKNCKVTKIESNCFSFSLAKYVTVGQNVTSVANNAFENAVFLETVTFKGSNITLGSSAFKNCKSLMIISAGQNLNKISVIGSGCFEGCDSLTSFTWSNSGSISADCFKNCKNLVNVTFNAATLEEGTFNGCTSLQNVRFYNANVTDLYKVFGSAKNKIPESLKTVTITSKGVTYNQTTGFDQKLN